MNKQVKKLWLKALLNKKYKQGSGQLVVPLENDPKTPDKFCCLGVLQNIYYLKRGESFPKKYFGNGMCHKKVAEWADIDDEIMEDLGERNDGHGGWKREQSFKKIANYIEKHL